MRNPLFAMLAAGQRPSRGIHTVHREAVIPASVDETFAFFAEATNLERLTPPWINFRIRTPLPIVMREGAVIDYRIGLYGLPIPWRTRIDVWEPGVRFVDRQVAGRTDGGATSTASRQRATAPAWSITWSSRRARAAMTARLVARDVRRIFDTGAGAREAL